MANALVALSVNPPGGDPMGAYTAGRTAALNDQSAQINQQGALQQQDHAALDEVGSLALGVLGGKIDGEVDPVRAAQAVQLLGEHNPLAAYVKDNPQVWKQIAQMVLDAKGGAGQETWGLTPQAYKLPDGSTQIGVLSNFGNFKPVALPNGATPAFPVQQLNTGTAFVPRDKFGNPLPDGAVTPIDNAGAAQETAIGKGMGEKIVNLPEVQATDLTALQGLQQQVGIVQQDIATAIQQIDANPTWNTGTLGDLIKAVPGTPQYDLAQTLLTIKANVGFDRLQQMRDASKTGGALGSISDTETQLLQAVNGALAQGQTADQLKANLERIAKLQQKVADEKQAAFNKKYGGNAPGSTASETGAGPSDPASMSDEELLKALNR